MNKRAYSPLALMLIAVLTACGGGGTPADTTKPTVNLTSSSNNVTAAGNITLTATASDNVGVSKVEFFDGATKLGEDTTSPYTFNVALTAANNGTKSYTAKAFDAAGNNDTSTAVSVTVNIAVDNTPPTVSLASSSTNVTVAGNITLTATATDNVGVTKVEFFDGAIKLGEDTTPGDGFTQTVALTIANNGTKSYTAKAFDGANNSATSTAVSVTVAIVADTKGPIVLKSTAKSSTTVEVVFNEAVVGGNVAGNFTIFSASVTTLAVTAASTSVDGKTVTLTTASQTPNEAYGFTAMNLKDLAGNALVLSDSNSINTNFTGFVP